MHSYPTAYNGIEYRSRLEAKWAAFFSLAGIPFEYEPFDLDGYIPDLILTGDYPVIVDIKPAMSRSELEERASSDQIQRARLSLPERENPYDWLFLGSGFSFIESEYLSDHEGPAVGIGLMTDRPADELKGLGTAILGQCSHFVETCSGRSYDDPNRGDPCWRQGVAHDWNWFGLRPHGCYHGGTIPAHDRRTVDHLWAQAVNAVKWNPRRA